MKFTIVKIDKKRQLHLTTRDAEAFIERIKTDSKSGDINKLRQHIANHGDNGLYEKETPVAQVFPSVEMAKEPNGNLAIVKFNGLVTLHVGGLLRSEDREAVKKASQMMPMTLAAFTGADGQSVELLVSVSRKDGRTLTDEHDIDLFCRVAYDVAFATYSGILPKPIERQAVSAKRHFRMTLDEQPFYNPQSTPLLVEAGERSPHLGADSGAIDEQREMDMDLYGDYEQIYQRAAEEAYEATSGVVESQWQNAYLTELANRLCALGVPEEEAFLHIHNHHVYKPHYSEFTLRSIVSAVYAECQPVNDEGSVEQISKETRRLIRFLKTRYVFRQNTVMGYVEYRPNNTWIVDWRPCNEQAINGLTIEARLSNIMARDKDVRRYVQSDFIRKSNPIDDFLWRIHDKWDGTTDHIGMLAHTVPCNIPQWKQWFRKWFLAMVAQWRGMTSDYGNAIVPLLISKQGDGKSTFCLNLLPKELRWGYMPSLDVAEKRQTLQAMHNFLLINLDEFNQVSAKVQQGFLKNVIQLPSVKLKRPYARHVEEFQRLASFIATTNEEQVLTDPTGNRRFICVRLTAPIDTAYKPNYEQLYSQAWQLLDQGEQYWFSADEVAQVVAHNRQYEVEPPAVLYFKEYYDPCDTPSAEGAQWLTATAIYQHLRRRVGAGLNVNGSSNFGRFLANMPGLQHRRSGKGNEYLVIPRL